MIYISDSQTLVRELLVSPVFFRAVLETHYINIDTFRRIKSS